MNDTTPPLSETAHASPPERKSIPLKLFCILLAVAWTAAIAASLWYNLSQLEEHALDSARIQARTAFEKDVVYRQWNSMHGGVFVPMIPGKFEPNPYLPEKGREIIAEDGKIYTKINPAYMTRLVHEIGALRTGVLGHITSNLPLRKGNEPDAWEKNALVQLENRTAEEVSDIAQVNGKDHMRLIRGLDTEASCMPCHAKQGYQVGDVRGGISVSVPMEPFMTAVKRSQGILFATHLSLWLVGLCALFFGAKRLSGGLKERDQAEDSLRKLTAELEQRVIERTVDLKIRQRELQAFVDNANAGVFLKDLDGVYRIANAQFAAILDRPLDLVRGRTNHDLLDAETAALIREHELTVISTGTSIEIKNGFISGQGARHSCFTFPVLEDDKVVGLGGLVVDMSERDRTELVLRGARDAAEKASRAKSDFLANMSHEIRTPLNGVIGMADLLLRTRLSSDQASMAAAIKTSGDSLLLVLNDVLDISKIEAGKLTLEKNPFLLRDVLFDSIKGLTPIAYKKNIEMILHISPQVPDHVVGDSVRLRQVIINLVNNALKFTEQGEVVVTALVVSSTDTTARLRFSVTDTGIGIPLEKQAHIFHAFEQADTSTTRKYGGTGLGLAICSRLLDLMDSKLELKSHEGFGSNFWFEVDLPIEDDSALPQKPLVCTEALKGHHVLIVDDNDTNLRILHETLTMWGLEVRQSKSVDEAYALASVAAGTMRPFKLILTDLQMPEKDGVDLLRVIRADSSLAHLPLILLTSGNLPNDIQGKTGHPGYFDAVLDKPVRPEMLMRAIAAALNIWESYDVQDIQRSEEQASEKSAVSLRVLLAEDVEMNQMVATRMLEELGHTVTVVGDGKQALEAVAVEEYDMVFMDIQMPVMDGVQATLAIREMERQGMLKNKTTIVAMTANALKGDKDKYLSVGMDGYLAKPILLADLRSIIAEMRDGEHSQELEKKQPQKLEPSWCTFHDAAHTSPRRMPAQPAEQPLSQSAAAPAQPPSFSAAGPESSVFTESTPEENTSPAEASSLEAREYLINWELLERSFAGNPDFIIDSMTLYMRDAPKLLQEAFGAVQRTDSGGLTVSAHALKGITGYFTREGAYVQCLDLEEAGRENNLHVRKPEVERLLDELQMQLDRLFIEMKEYISRTR